MWFETFLSTHLHVCLVHDLSVAAINVEMTMVTRRAALTAEEHFICGCFPFCSLSIPSSSFQSRPSSKVLEFFLSIKRQVVEVCVLVGGLASPIFSSK